MKGHMRHRVGQVHHGDLRHLVARQTHEMSQPMYHRLKTGIARPLSDQLSVNLVCRCLTAPQ